MGWRTVVITKTSKLDYSLGYMVVRDVENKVKYISVKYQFWWSAVRRFH